MTSKELGQCVAPRWSRPISSTNWREGCPLFGCVTTGEVWQFLKLAGSEVLMDRRRYYFDNLDSILGVIRAIGEQA